MKDLKLKSLPRKAMFLATAAVVAFMISCSDDINRPRKDDDKGKDPSKEQVDNTGGKVQIAELIQLWDGSKKIDPETFVADTVLLSLPEEKLEIPVTLHQSVAEVSGENLPEGWSVETNEEKKVLKIGAPATSPEEIGEPVKVQFGLKDAKGKVLASVILPVRFIPYFNDSKALIVLDKADKGDLSFVSSKGEVLKNIFSQRNPNEKLGANCAEIAEYKGLYYVLSTEDKQITVMDAKTLRVTETISTGDAAAKHFAVVDHEHIYLSDAAKIWKLNGTTKELKEVELPKKGSEVSYVSLEYSYDKPFVVKEYVSKGTPVRRAYTFIQAVSTERWSSADELIVLGAEPENDGKCQSIAIKESMTSSALPRPTVEIANAAGDSLWLMSNAKAGSRADDRYILVRFTVDKSYREMKATDYKYNGINYTHAAMPYATIIAGKAADEVFYLSHGETPEIHKLKLFPRPATSPVAERNWATVKKDETVLTIESTMGKLQGAFALNNATGHVFVIAKNEEKGNELFAYNAEDVDEPIFTVPNVVKEFGAYLVPQGSSR